MAVMVRERWTDERLDEAFDRVDADLREPRVETKKGFERVDGKIDALDEKFDRKIDALDEKFDCKFDALDEKFDRKFDSLQRNMTTWFIAMCSTTITLAAAVIAAAALG